MLGVAGGALAASWAMMAIPGVGGGRAFGLGLTLATLPLWMGSMAVAGAYRYAYFNAGTEALRRFLLGSVGGTLSLTFLAFFVNRPISRLLVVVLVLTAFAIGCVARLGFRSSLLRAYRRGQLIERTLVIGCNRYSVDLCGLMTEGSSIPYRAVGLLWITGLADERPGGLDVPVIDEHEPLLAACDRLRVDVVLVSSDGFTPKELRDLVLPLEGARQRVIITRSYSEIFPWRMTVETHEGLTLLHVSEAHPSGLWAFAKRLTDLIGATLLLVLLSPVMFAAAVTVLVACGRPVLYRQSRIGRNGRPFELLKLRTMVRDAETHLGGIRDRNEAGRHYFKIADDPRTTRVGHFLRRWSIDEIPQLFMVLRGDMSLVGPRPLFSHPDEYSLRERRRLMVLPGLTGLWQVSGRSTMDSEAAIQLDLHYVDNWTLVGDFIILAKTVRAVLMRQGAS